MSEKTKTYLRFPLSRRIEHILLLSTFILLAATGLPQKYPNSAASAFIAQILGGIENLYKIHHAATVVVMFAVTYHLLTIAYQVFVLRSKWSMMLYPQDMKDGLQALLYNLGFAKSPPKMGRYTFEEKFEYWAFVWGYTVMAITGFMMWNPVTTFKYLPGEFFPAARAAHGGEAVLAVLAILVWHMYHVRIKRVNNAMFTGKLSEAAMEEDHPLELEEIKAGTANRKPDAATLRKRLTVFYPLAAAFTAIMLFGAYKYVTIEQTAVEVVPPISAPANQTP
ncbi:MAG: cytochrome b/b6 domain-containing protein [Anaerolineales bacterium]|nr:cytochrome b/b6 domain-containing protein [Anaerolineales bacterium]